MRPFESLSGLTTTGATVLTGLDDLPRSVLFYRQLLQWLGGMGIIVLAVAVLPMLGVGGMQLYRAESPGPIKDSKLTPRIAHTAKALWYIYLGLTVLCGFAYWVAGMNGFDGHLPCVFDGCHRRLLHPRLEHRLFRQRRDRDRGHRLHGARRDQLRAALCRIGSAQSVPVLAGCGSCACTWALWRWSAPWWWQRCCCTARTLRRHFATGCSGGLLCDHHRLHHPEYSAWPGLGAGSDGVRRFRWRLCGLHGGGVEDVPSAADLPPGVPRNPAADPSDGIFHIKLGERIVPNRVVEAVWGSSAST